MTEIPKTFQLTQTLTNTALEGFGSIKTTRDHSDTRITFEVCVDEEKDTEALMNI